MTHLCGVAGELGPELNFWVERGCFARPARAYAVGEGRRLLVGCRHGPLWPGAHGGTAALFACAVICREISYHQVWQCCGTYVNSACPRDQECQVLRRSDSCFAPEMHVMQGSIGEGRIADLSLLRDIQMQAEFKYQFACR